MVDVTERAKQELKRLLSEKVDMPQARLRVMDNGRGGLGLGIDVEVPGDRVVEYKGSNILVVESELAARLKGVTIDVDDTAGVAELVVSGTS